MKNATIDLAFVMDAGAASGDGLAEVLMAFDGLNKSSNGDFVVDEESARKIEAGFAALRRDLVIDYEHQTMGGEFASPDGTAKAAGWIKSLKYTAGRGLVAMVEWTQRAREMIRAKEYRYISPVLRVLKESKKAIELLHAGITNDPAIHGMEALAASRRNSSERTGDPVDQVMELRKKIAGKLGITIADGADELAVLKAIDAWQPAKGATEADEIAAETRKALGLKADAPKPEVVLSLTRKLGETSELTAMKEKLAELEGREADRTAETLFETYVKANKINPRNEAEVKASKEWARKDPVAFKAFMEAKSPYMPAGQTTPPSGSTGAGVSGDDKLIADALTVHKGDYKAAYIAVQKAVLQPFLDQGLTPAAARQQAERAHPTVFGAAA